MALINCPGCGRKVSDQAERCPGCGITINNRINEKIERKSREKSEKKKFVIGIALLIIIFGGGMLFNAISQADQERLRVAGQETHEQEDDRTWTKKSSNHTYDEDQDDDTESTWTKRSSNSTYDSKQYEEDNNEWHKNYDGNGYYNDDGYAVYSTPDGATEITDGYGNWARDTDGDGQLDTFGSDNE